MGISTDHDILTDNGWVNISQLTLDSYIATLNSLTGCIEYHKPTNLTNTNYIGQMYNIVNDSINLCITPDQSLYVSKEDNKWYLDCGQNLFDGVYKLSSNMLNISSDISTFTFTGTNKKVTMNKWLPLFGLYVRYGTIINANAKIISITNINIEKFTPIVNSLNVDLKNDVQVKILSYNIDSNGLATTMLKIPDYMFMDLTTNIPQWAFRLNSKQLLLLLCDSLLDLPTTDNKTQIDTLHALYLLAGKPFQIKQQLNGIYYLTPQGMITNVNQFTSDYVGIIYNLQVRNFTYMARKNGKPIFI